MQWGELSCGHSVPMLEHDRPDDPPRRPRVCAVCPKQRNVVGLAK
jgi:hypothetical protein